MASARGRFITLEGGEGAGKSTLAAALKAGLASRGHSVLLTREPGGTPGAERIRDLILSPPEDMAHWQPLTETLLFFAARSDHLDKTIRPALARGEWVICDRFSDSTRAYQAAAGGVQGNYVEMLDGIAVGKTQPDLTLVLDLPLDAARARLSSRGRPYDAIESRTAGYHEAVRQAFLDIARANPQRCVVLDASRAPAEIAAAALAAVDVKFGSG